jgi:hypothetical protein
MLIYYRYVRESNFCSRLFIPGRALDRRNCCLFHLDQSDGVPHGPASAIYLPVFSLPPSGRDRNPDRCSLLYAGRDDSGFRSQVHSLASEDAATLDAQRLSGGWPTLDPLERLWVAHPCGFVFCKGGPAFR